MLTGRQLVTGADVELTTHFWTGKLEIDLPVSGMVCTAAVKAKQ